MRPGKCRRSANRLVVGKNMAKKHKHLYAQICTFNNLWQASRNARRGKRTRTTTAEFEYHLEENLLNLQHYLQNETYQFGAYNQFTITDPRERLICAAPYRDRVVHHAICRIIEPLLDQAMSHHSYACRIGKGTHRALDHAQQGLRTYSWVLRIDLRKYFFSIDHEHLLHLLSRKLSDRRLLKLLHQLLATYTSGPDYYFPLPQDTLFDTLRPRGLPIGNLTSQIFANYYLTPLDRFIEQSLKLPHYVRYMDDALIFGKQKTHLHRVKQDIQTFLHHYRLHLHPRKTQIFPARNGVPFLGFMLRPGHRRIRRENLQRFKRRMAYQRKAYQSGLVDMQHLLHSLQAWTGFVGKDQHRALINQILSHQPFQNPDSQTTWHFVLPTKPEQRPRTRNTHRKYHA